MARRKRDSKGRFISSRARKARRRAKKMPRDSKGRFKANKPKSRKSSRRRSGGRRNPPRDDKGRFISRSRGSSRRTKRRNPMASKSKTPPRDSKGRFVSTSRKRSRRRSRGRSRANPPAMVGKLLDGVVGAGQALTGKVVVRVVPDMVGLQTTGSLGLAIQAATAIGLGLAAERALSRDAAHLLLVGGLMAPMESLVSELNIPVVSPALSGYGRYVPGGSPLGRYVPSSAASNGARGLARARGVASDRGRSFLPDGAGIF